MLRLSLACLLAVTVVSHAHAADAPYTRFRKGHTLRLLCREGAPLEVTIHSISASLGYTDATAYELIGPDGRTLARDTLPPGASGRITVDRPAPGVYLLMADPGMNAFGVEIDGVPWAVDVTSTLQVNVIDHARPLHFWLPPEMTRLELTFEGEEATVEVCDPAGETVATVKVPNYVKTPLSLEIPPGAAGAFWSLRLTLAEDLGIIFPPQTGGIIADQPLDRDTFRRLLATGAPATFDRRPVAAEALLRAAQPPVAVTVGAAVLAMEFGRDGSVVGLHRDGLRLSPSEMHPQGGFLARDVAAGSGFVPLAGSVAAEGDGATVEGEFPGLDLRLTASIRPARGALQISGDLQDTTGTDRAISLYFALPLDAAGWTWHDDVNTAREVQAAGLHSNDAACAAGANGFHSLYPLACLSGPSSVAVGVDPSQPRIFRLGYEAGTRQFFCAFDLGLSPEVLKSPSRASFSLSVYATDPAWGFRSAVERYWDIYRESFEVRMKRHGGWICWGTLEGIPEVEATGMLYHWGPSPSGVRYSDEVGVYSVIYNDSVRFFMDLGLFDGRPTAAQAAERFQAFMEAEDPLAFVLDAPEKATGRARWLALRQTLGEEGLRRRAHVTRQAVRNSHCLNSDGRPIPGYILDRKDWGPENWWTGRLHCNPNPDIPDGYGRFLLNEWIAHDWANIEALGGRPDGIGLDNYFVNANDLNYRREHFQYADIPLTFDRTGRLALSGDFQLMEWVAWLKQWLVERDGYLIPNAWGLGWPFYAPLMDMIGLEGGYETERVQFYHRTLAGHKPLVTLPMDPRHYTEPWIKLHLAAGMMPGGYGGAANLKQRDSDYRKLLDRYMPVLRAMGAAGWEPVTRAHADPPELGIERFGRGEAGEVFFSVRNRGDDLLETTVRLDLPLLGFPQGVLQVTQPVSGERLATAESTGGPLILPVRLEARDATVVRVAPPRAD